MRRSALGCSWWGLCALIFLGSGAVAPLQAAPSWEGGGACSSREGFQRELEQAGLEGVDSDLRFRVKEQGGGYSMQVFDGDLVTHKLNAQSCRELLDAALMILKLGQGDAPGRDRGGARSGSMSSSSSGANAEASSGQGTGVSEKELDQDDSVLEEKAQPADANRVSKSKDLENKTQAEVLPSESAKTEKVKRQASQARAQRRARRRARWANRKRLAGLVIGQGGGGLGALPSLHGQGMLDAGLQFGSWRVLVGGFGHWGARSPESVPPEWRAKFRTLGGRALGCYVAGRGPWRWPLCAGGNAGQLRAWRETDAPGPKQVDALWWSLLVQVGVELEVTRRIFATASLNAALLPLRPQVQIENGPGLCCAMVQGAATLGMGVRVGRVP